MFVNLLKGLGAILVRIIILCDNTENSYQQEPKNKLILTPVKVLRFNKSTNVHAKF